MSGRAVADLVVAFLVPEPNLSRGALKEDCQRERGCVVGLVQSKRHDIAMVVVSARESRRRHPVRLDYPPPVSNLSGNWKPTVTNALAEI